MTHNDIRHKLSEYIDGSVTPDEKATIEEHFRTCGECADAMRELRKTIEHVHAVEEVRPPAWMTQKIMAKVRAEAQEKKGFFRRLFYPLAVKLPIQAVAVLFLTVTVYYIYNSMHPADKYGEAPLERIAKEESRPAAAMPERKEPELSGSKEKKAEQSPGYKSLDMKYSYEKPAPPAPVEAPAAAAPAKRAAPMTAKDEAAPPAGQTTRRAAAPPMMAEQAAPSAGAGTSREGADRAAAVAGKVSDSLSRDREAEAQLAVTEHFTKFDLPEKMKVKGLTFSARRFHRDLADLQWLPETAAYRSSACGDKYIVDVDLSGRSSKYLYCHDASGVTLLGVFEAINGRWTEIR